jgi:hypothetical protein
MEKLGILPFLQRPSEHQRRFGAGDAVTSAIKTSPTFILPRHPLSKLIDHMIHISGSHPSGEAPGL